MPTAQAAIGMKAGKLDRRITIKTVTLTQNETGEEIESEVTLATVWAFLMEQRPGEVFAAGSDMQKEQVIFQVRNRNDLNTTMKVVYKTDRYEITGIKEVGRNNRLNLVCERQGDNV